MSALPSIRGRGKALRPDWFQDGGCQYSHRPVDVGVPGPQGVPEASRPEAVT